MATRYGVGELFGKSFANLTPKKMRELAHTPHKSMTCPFKGSLCSKSGGVCSLRLYTQDTKASEVLPADNHLVTVCPNRFFEKNIPFKWISKTLLENEFPVTLTELPFLLSHAENTTERPVGKIDMVLVHPDLSIIRWCALELQAVYFSGSSMSKELKIMQGWQGPGLPFPQGIRRPDFRSSGPKRLMPQLQIKVPTISRWGKKVAVIVDKTFWESMGEMSTVEHVSNCDIAWFVVTYQKAKN